MAKVLTELERLEELRALDKRCTKKDGALGPGSGCIRTGPHTGRHTIREDAARLYQTGDVPPASDRRGASKRGSLGHEMTDLAELATRIEAEASGLIADCRLAIDSIRQTAAGVNVRNRTLLKSLVKSRREVQALIQHQAGQDPDDDPDD